MYIIYKYIIIMTFIIILFLIFVENESNSKDPPIVMAHLYIIIT